MRSALIFLLLGSSAVAAVPAAPPKPPHVWHVLGYKWDGSQWVKQNDRSLATSDFKQAVDYLNVVNSHHDWVEVDDLPKQSYTALAYDDSNYPQVPSQLPAPTYQVWAFKLIEGKWVKQPAYSHEFRVPERAWQYQASVNAVPGWQATTDLPPEVPTDQRKQNMHRPVPDFPYPYWYSTDLDG